MIPRADTLIVKVRNVVFSYDVTGRHIHSQGEEYGLEMSC
jgi:hypothetical protein